MDGGEACGCGRPLQVCRERAAMGANCLGEVPSRLSGPVFVPPLSEGDAATAFEAALKRLVKEWLERGETAFSVARHLMLAASALLSVHEKLADQKEDGSE